MAKVHTVCKHQENVLRISITKKHIFTVLKNQKFLSLRLNQLLSKSFVLKWYQKFSIAFVAVFSERGKLIKKIKEDWFISYSNVWGLKKYQTK